MEPIDPAIFFELPIPIEPDKRDVEWVKDRVEFMADYLWNKLELYDILGSPDLYYSEFKAIVRGRGNLIEEWLEYDYPWAKFVETILFDLAEYVRLKQQAGEL
ncbi:hypothetical protein [Palaeococcus ferrophilus]|uniref:hypothetical protein n=1 Tax=Palaeococcus ferrophilus TaxID=83868 RepID=UPI00064FEDF5|nr:hypothetical protein [Palaeococcus ferrophilus]